MAPTPPTDNGPIVILINGPINSGKTTVAKALSRLLPRSAHVEIDSLHEFIEWMPLEESIPLNLKNAAAVGRNLIEYGLNVIVTYPLNAVDYRYLADQFSDYTLHCFTLCPPLKIAQHNRGGRELTEWEISRIAFHYASGIASPQFETTLIDNAHQTPRQTAQHILDFIVDST